jgi:hypothetical protein
MRRAELAAMVVAALAAAGCGGSGGGSTAASKPRPATTSHATSTGTSGSTSSSTSTATTPIETSTSGHRPRCAYCGAGLHLASAARAALTAANPRIGCELLVTPRYVTTAYGGGGGCAAAIKGGAAARALRVLTTKRTGRRALVVAVPAGGPNAGERLRIAMLREPAKLPRGPTPPLWRVDAVRSNAKVGP